MWFGLQFNALAAIDVNGNDYPENILDAYGGLEVTDVKSVRNFQDFMPVFDNDSGNVEISYIHLPDMQTIYRVSLRSLGNNVFALEPSLINAPSIGFSSMMWDGHGVILVQRVVIDGNIYTALFKIFGTNGYYHLDKLTKIY